MTPKSQQNVCLIVLIRICYCLCCILVGAPLRTGCLRQHCSSDIQTDRFRQAQVPLLPDRIRVCSGSLKLWQDNLMHTGLGLHVLHTHTHPPTAPPPTPFPQGLPGWCTHARTAPIHKDAAMPVLETIPLTKSFKCDSF